MLELKNIKKVYEIGNKKKGTYLKVDALKGISIKFRKSEFVSILGPSGCGKTTLLNIIGGLDKYTSGDLIINGKSTKKFTDKDWDTYRNHSIGFVFQSYNLIPHQTVLENVQLALTLSGISKKERERKAKEVLKRVGLKDKMHSKPNQLSGGQMQRVAIARALVNDPDIILADEPTGALDSKTSIQIMDLLHEISNEKLIIMVTHNPELANTYSSRIIRLSDGELISDSDPIADNETISDDDKLISMASDDELTKREIRQKNKKKSMSFFTALSLSFKNLLTKKARTFLVAFAGSIGIIGIALVLAISSGFNSYINKRQEDTLSSYPITIEAKSVDFTSVIMAMLFDNSINKTVDHDKDGVYPKDSISTVMSNVGNSLSANNLKKFYKYINDNYDDIKDVVSAIQYTYNLDVEFYSNNNIAIQPGSNAIMQMIIKYSLFYFQNETQVELNFLENGNYEIAKIDGKTDYTFIDNYPNLTFIKLALENNGKIELTSSQVAVLSFTILGLDTSSLSGGSSSGGSMFGDFNIFYECIDNVELIQSQYDLIGENSQFPTQEQEALLVLDKNNEIDEYVLYALGLIDDDTMNDMLRAVSKGNRLNVKVDYDSIIGTEYKVLTESDYFVSTSDDKLVDFRIYSDVSNSEYDMAKYIQYYTNALNNTTNKVVITGIVRLNDSSDYGSLATGIAYTSKFTERLVNYNNNSVAAEQGYVEKLTKDNPSSINIYVNTFEAKDTIEDFIAKYNENAQQGDEITYTDYVGIIMNTVSVIINAITYVLIAFVGVSLIVSSIMIGIITYISVLERTKEIGVLRSVGASKRDVKRVFTAESFIIGLTSGVFGVLVALLFTLPINLILVNVTSIANIAQLPVLGAVILVAISVFLTYIAGLIPAHIASKKDPVIALRTE